MSPVRGKKAKSASKKKKKSARPPRPKTRSKAKKAAKASGGKRAFKVAGKRQGTVKAQAPGKPERRRCVAVDPFGDPCQSAPRLPSKYCTIHSYLDR